MWLNQRTSTFALVCVALWNVSAIYADDGRFVRHLHTDSAGEHRYAVFVPAKGASSEPLPIILFLHSASERGSDGEKQTNVGLGPAIRARAETFPFLAVFPQCDDTISSVQDAWGPAATAGQRALAILDEVITIYNVDKNRVYLIGCSMGGYGAWAHAAADPDRWAAVVPICGGGNTQWAEQLRDVPIWSFHGADDRAVLPKESHRMVDAVRRAGGNVRYSELPKVGHNAWDTALHFDELYRWLLRQERGIRSAPTPVAPALTARAPLDSAPFRPGLDIPHAATVRLGNDMLDSLGRALPRMQQAQVLRGTLPDRRTTSSTRVGSMSVRFVGVSYQGRLGRARIKAREDGTLAISFRARDVILRIHRTYVSGAGRSATCGPLQIRIGHLYDLQMRCVVRPAISDRQLRLQVEDADFRIPSDNWHVGSPAWVQTRGLGMTRDRVSSSLSQGIYRDRERIERQFVQVLPAIMDRITTSLPMDRVEDLVRGMWPMPVFAPRVRAWPSAVTVDADGATLQFGISVAALNEQQAAAGPKLLKVHAGDNAQPAAGTDFQMSFMLAVLELGSQQMVDADVARLLVVDSPLKRLMPLADATALSMLVPDLQERQGVSVRSELIMEEPFRLISDGAEDSDGLAFEMPKVLCQISLPSTTEPTGWAPYLNIAFRIRQKATIEFSQPTPGKCAMAVDWKDAAAIDVEAHFSPHYAPSDASIDTNQLRNIVASAWEEWTTTGPLASVAIEDLELGPDRLRANRLGWDGHQITATFVPAGIVIRNGAEESATYETKGPFSNWSDPTQIAAMKTHRFEVAYPFQCRFQSGAGPKTYTLIAGRRYEFRADEDRNLELYALPDRPLDDI